MKAYTQMMGGKHRIVMFAPAGQRVALLTAYSSKASAHQALCTLGFDPVEEPAAKPAKASKYSMPERKTS
jgi:hypothetical protein